MKKYLKVGLIANIITYLFIAFVKWDIVWVTIIPTMYDADRALGAIAVIVINMAFIAIYTMIVE